jgi:glycosyltransferase involved in cell wall biosynthesis
MITYCIPSKNNLRYLKSCIPSIQQFSHYKNDILVYVDQDNDGTPDVLEVAKYGVDAEIKRAQVANESRALDHQIENDKEKNKLKAKEIAQKGAGK